MSFQSLFQNCQKNNRLKNQNNQLLHVFIALKRRYSVRFCNIRKYFVPKGVMRWIPKNSEIPHDKVNVKGPTFVREPNLVA